MAAAGEVKQVIGPVVDVAFPEADMPDIYTALEIKEKGIDLTIEVALHIGENRPDFWDKARASKMDGICTDWPLECRRHWRRAARPTRIPCYRGKSKSAIEAAKCAASQSRPSKS